jgi:hypothetical protein
MNSQEKLIKVKEIFLNIGKKMLKTSYILSLGIIWRAPKLLNRFKFESEMKTSEKQGVGARSLARSTLGVEGRVGAPRWD